MPLLLPPTTVMTTVSKTDRHAACLTVFQTQTDQMKIPIFQALFNFLFSKERRKGDPKGLTERSVLEFFFVGIGSVTSEAALYFNLRFFRHNLVVLLQLALFSRHLFIHCCKSQFNAVLRFLSFAFSFTFICAF